MTLELAGGQEATVEVDKVLVSVGRRPNSENLGLEAVGVKIERGFVTVDRRMRTNVPGIYAIGDWRDSRCWRTRRRARRRSWRR